MKELLKFSPGNAKLKGIPSMSLLSGHACPFANKCYARVDLVTGKIIDGPDTEFRCFSATQENIFPSVRKQRQHNFELLRKLKTKEAMVEVIQQSLPFNVRIIRLHVAGDFFNQTYFDAWTEIARKNPDVIFYAYTKSLQYWVNRIGTLPENFRLTASKGGKLDNLIQEYNLKYAQVVFSNEEAEELGLEVDHDDSHAYGGSDKSFGLLIHGTQKAGSKASKAKQALAVKGWTGYQRAGGYGNKRYKKAA